MIDVEQLVGDILSAGGRVKAAKRQFGLDVVNYDWVKDYIRDKKIREEIDSLQKEIQNVQSSLVDRDELREIFNQQINGTKTAYLEILEANISQVQNRKEALIKSANPQQFLILAISKVLSEDIENIFQKLPAGVKQSEIDGKVEKLNGKISQLQKTIDEELSPQTRWVHTESGHRVKYPKGCRWKIFVEAWKKIVSRTDGICNLERCVPESEAEIAAYKMLELDQVRKITPLQKPFKK